MPELKRTLGVYSLTLYGVGMILGAGIYTIIGKAAGIAGASLWLSLLIAAFTALFTAFSYAELSSMNPKAGAEFIYLSDAFPKFQWIGKASGFMLIFSGATTAAAVAIAFAGYLGEFFIVNKTYVTFGALVFFTLVNILGIQLSSRINVLFTAIEIIGLLIFILLGVNSDSFADHISVAPSFKVLPAASLLLFAYLGFENIASLSVEAKNPTKTIPIAIISSLLISAVLYILVGLSAVSLMPATELANAPAPLLDAARSSSPFWAETIGVIALFSTANTILIALLSSSRIIYGMANEKVIHSYLKTVHRKHRTPWVASLSVFFIAFVIAPLGKVDLIASISSFSTLIVFIFINLAVIWLRFKKPNEKRAFRSPFHLGKLPILPVFGVLSALLLLFSFEFKG